MPISLRPILYRVRFILGASSLAELVEADSLALKPGVEPVKIPGCPKTETHPRETGSTEWEDGNPPVYGEAGGVMGKLWVTVPTDEPRVSKL